SRRDLEAALKSRERLRHFPGEKVRAAEIQDDVGVEEVSARGGLTGLDGLGSGTVGYGATETVIREVAHLRALDPVLDLNEDGGLEMLCCRGGVTCDHRSEPFAKGVLRREYMHERQSFLHPPDAELCT